MATNTYEQWDDTARTYTARNAAGAVTAQRAYTAGENAAADARAAEQTAVTNQATLETRAGNALAANATYLAIATPTNAQVSAQVRALTQQSSNLIRMVLHRLDATD